MPPPRVSPATPVVEMIPPVVASPKLCAAWSKSPQSQPPCTRAIRRLRVDPDPLHRAEVEHDAVVDRPEPGNAVRAVPDGEGEAALAGRVDGDAYVGDVYRAHDREWAPVDHRVVDGTRLVVLGRLCGDHLAAGGVEDRECWSAVHDDGLPVLLDRAGVGWADVWARPVQPKTRWAWSWN